MKTNNSQGSSKGGEKKQTKSSSHGKNEVATKLQELFEAELKDIYWAEKALVKAYPKLIKNATSEELIEALEEHLSVTEEQVKRVEEVFAILGVKAEAKTCDAMQGLLTETEKIMAETEKGMVRDAGIISAAQKVEHYEIASYGTLCSFATTLGFDDAAALLRETLDEEKEADENLTEIAESSINIEAMSEEE